MKNRFTLHLNGEHPIYRQIMNRVITGIERGHFRDGEALPSSRALAEQLGVNRATVYRAYEELRALGYLHARPGSYSVVRRRNAQNDHAKKPDWSKISALPTDQLLKQYQRHRSEASAANHTTFICMTRLQVDPRLYPVKDFRRCMHHVLSEQYADALTYGHEQGYPPLREEIVHRMRYHGIHATAEELLITNGAQQAMDLICRVFEAQDAGIAVEAPTYSGVIPLFRFNGYRLYSIPMRDDGMDLRALETTLMRQNIRFIYTMPNFHNPMGVTTSHAHREALLRLSVQYGVPIVEDGFEEEMKYYGRVPMPIKSLNDSQGVIYVGSFSKALFAGLRVGWILADAALIRRLMAVKYCTDLSGGHLAQQVLYEFCRQGYYEKHLARLHRAFRKRMDLTLRLMQNHFPDTVQWVKPLGGYSVWIRLPKKITESELVRHTQKQRVEVTHGSYFFPQAGHSDYIRICIASLNESEIEEGILRLSRVLKNLFRSQR